MKIKQKAMAVVTLMLITVFAVSCVDEWDEHYNAKPLDKIDKNLYEYLKSQDSLSIFTEMIEVSGYDTLLTKSQSFTVWAPTNSALQQYLPTLLLLKEVGSISDDFLLPGIFSLDDIRKVVSNHITRFNQTTSGLKVRSLLMLNGKIAEFSKSGTVVTLGGMVVSKSDIAVNNGIVHVLGQMYPYRQNLWEFINNEPGLDSLRVFLNSLTVDEFDPEASIVDGVLMDSIMREANILLEEVAALNTEDSTYSAILPDNGAWNEAYSRIYPFFKTSEADGGELVRDYRTKWSLVKDLFFRGKLNAPVTADTLYSTYGNAFTAPARLFENSQSNVMSNGMAYVSPQLKYTALDAWFKPIRVEAEASYYGRLLSNYTPAILSGLGTGVDISNRNYALFIDASQSSLSTLFVSFPIPNTLSGKYNIYCVFVPASLVDSTDLRPYKVKFSLKYTDSAGKVVNFGSVNANNEVKAPNATKATFTTNPNMVDKMLVVKDFEFPYSNIVDFSDPDYLNNISVALKVENDTKKNATEMKNFNRNLRIDCIILEPVQ